MFPAIAVLFISLNLVCWMSCTLVYNTNCVSKEFTRRYPKDSTLYENGLLEEIQVTERTECFPLCNRKLHCNKVLYNSLTSKCRLYQHLHYNDSETGITEAGWEHYGVTCQASGNASDCQSIFPSLLGSCYSCMDGNYWKFQDFCLLYQRSHSNLGGDLREEFLPFNLSTDMAVIVQGGMFASETEIQIYLDSQDQIYYAGVDLNVPSSNIEASTETQSSTFGGSFPILNPNDFTITFYIKAQIVQIYADGTFIEMFPRSQEPLISIYLGGLDDVHKVAVTARPFYCA